MSVTFDVDPKKLLHEVFHFMRQPFCFLIYA